ncbi:M20/M25/M40 family metallo-hydrolase [bacterium]|nr:M20/M25/M40 family metallo-hydrolase [bacterium]
MTRHILKLRRLFVIGFSIALSGCTPIFRPYETVAEKPFDLSRLMSDLRFLSSDLLEGREAGTRGEKIASLYLAGQLQRAGIQPFAYDGDSDSLTYFQKFEATKVTVLGSSVVAIYDSAARSEKIYTYGDYFANFHNFLFECHTAGQFVFAGYGITAPEFGYDDYKNLDVNDKIVLVFDGEPESDDEKFFYGPIPSSYHSALFYKRHRARELGAKALFVLGNETIQEKWSELVGYFKASRIEFSTPDLMAADSTRIPFYYASELFFRTILKNSPVSYDSLRQLIVLKKNLPAFTVEQSSARINVMVDYTRTEAQNVVGVIAGNDPVLKNEYVALGSHYDHLGVSGGEIHNGADDDASGTVTVLEIARAIARSKTNKRSVLVVFHSGEEKGLLGSEYMTDEDTRRPFELSQIVCQLNFDMVGRESADSIYVIGSDKLSSELKKLNEETNKELGLFTFDYFFDDPFDPNRYYYRSDHYNYARWNIPIVFFFDGMTEDYHKPGDDFEKINFKKIEKISKLGFHLTLKVANLNHRLRLDYANE